MARVGLRMGDGEDQFCDHLPVRTIIYHRTDTDTTPLHTIKSLHPSTTPHTTTPHHITPHHTILHYTTLNTLHHLLSLNSRWVTKVFHDIWQAGGSKEALAPTRLIDGLTEKRSTDTRSQQCQTVHKPPCLKSKKRYRRTEPASRKH